MNISGFSPELFNWTKAAFVFDMVVAVRKVFLGKCKEKTC